MARNKLTDSRVKAAAKPGLLGDGDGLWLNVSKGGTKSWLFIFIRDGRRREMGLGAFGAGTGRVSLAQARVKADEVRTILGAGGDPFVEMGERKPKAVRKTFAQVVDEFLADASTQWRNPKHRAQWTMTLGDAYCARLRRKLIDEIDTDDVVAVLEPVWREKHETASRLRGRIERVLDFARVAGLRSGENPARWKGHIEHRLAKPNEKLSRGHHAAMPHADVSAFLTKLATVQGAGARALEFAIHTAGRTGEVMGARWEEIDLEAAVWTVPASRMKAHREHRVPLTAPAVAAIKAMQAVAINDFVFAGAKRGTHISNMTMTKALRSAGGSEFTCHGFRSSFRDWVHELTAFPDQLAEAALAHIVGDATERAYRRSDALARRRKMMVAWSDYVTRQHITNVVPIRKGA